MKGKLSGSLKHNANASDLKEKEFQRKHYLARLRHLEIVALTDLACYISCHERDSIKTPQVLWNECKTLKCHGCIQINYKTQKN